MIEIYTACGAWAFVNIIELHRWFRWLNFKPINCDVCLAGWITLATSFKAVYWPYLPLHMALAMVMVIFLNKLLK